ncbi:iron-containing alcohol dehydrogenase, partial [Photobacterium leiognathi]
AELASKELKKALIVTDSVLVEVGLVSKLTDELTAHGIDFTIYDGVQPNPTEKNIEDGLELLANSHSDFV